jgi:hypothetical protein
MVGSCHSRTPFGRPRSRQDTWIQQLQHTEGSLARVVRPRRRHRYLPTWERFATGCARRVQPHSRAAVVALASHCVGRSTRIGGCGQTGRGRPKVFGWKVGGNPPACPVASLGGGSFQSPRRQYRLIAERQLLRRSGRSALGGTQLPLTVNSGTSARSIVDIWCDRRPCGNSGVIGSSACDQLVAKLLRCLN